MTMLDRQKYCVSTISGNSNHVERTNHLTRNVDRTNQFGRINDGGTTNSIERTNHFEATDHVESTNHFETTNHVESINHATTSNESTNMTRNIKLDGANHGSSRMAEATSSLPDKLEKRIVLDVQELNTRITVIHKKQNETEQSQEQDNIEQNDVVH